MVNHSPTATRSRTALRVVVGLFIVVCLIDFVGRCVGYTGADFSVMSALLAASPLVLAASAVPIVLSGRSVAAPTRAAWRAEAVLGIGVGVCLLLLRPDSLVLMSALAMAAMVVAITFGVRSLIRRVQPQ